MFWLRRFFFSAYTAALLDESLFDEHSDNVLLSFIQRLGDFFDRELVVEEEDKIVIFRFVSGAN